MTRIIYAPGAPKARATALSWLGKKFRPGYCLYFQLVNIFKVPGLGDYDHDGDADCHDYWKAAKKRGTVVETSDPAKIPAGALVIWTGRKYGHAAFALGDGEVVTTDLPTRGVVGRYKIADVQKAWPGLKVAGYVEVDGNGFTLRQPAPKPTPPPAPVEYVVRAKDGVNHRQAPSVKAKKLGAFARGRKVRIDRVVKNESRQWGHVVAGGYVALEYLVKVA